MSHLARFLAIAISITACGGLGVVGNGKSTSEVREVGAFKKLEVSGGVHVTFTKGARAVSVTADDNLIHHVETIVRDDTLFVKLSHPVADSSGIKATISNDFLEGLSLSGGSSFVGPATTTPSFSIEASGGSIAEVSELASADVSVSASGGSEVTLTGGSSTRLAVSSSGGSQVNAHGFTTETGAVDVSGGSTVCIFCSKAITGNASGGSTVTVTGSPATASVNSSGGSRLIKEN